MVSFKIRQNISIVSFCEEKMNLIESGIQLASINLAWNLSSAILGRAPSTNFAALSSELLEDL